MSTYTTTMNDQDEETSNEVAEENSAEVDIDEERSDVYYSDNEGLINSYMDGLIYLEPENAKTNREKIKKYLHLLYQERHQWVRCYTRHFFTVGIFDYEKILRL